MIYFALCAAIACLVAHQLRRMQFKFVGAGVVWGASIIGGLLAGSMLAVGLLTATGAAPQHSALPALIGQGFWWSLLGTAVGYFSSKLPTQAIIIGVAVGCASLLMFGNMRTTTPTSSYQADAPRPAVVNPTNKDDSFDPSRAIPLSTYQEMQKAGDDFNPARAVPLRN